ncbi:hypothetical protein [Heyndrickxia acidicola]|uniref:Uncharacterized protein n=1 Tax=Heyndrickxia acidicola TaxID=209389 RepID=A0ABU6MH07_9BACI|nr:hypothetical protein [Heyndrickxia acidicola]MED1203965.1 hypothetical protein [Heyndrickxia acidicola]
MEPKFILKSLFNIIPKLIEVEGTRLLREQRVCEDPAGASDEEASQPPRGKRVSCCVNQPAGIIRTIHMIVANSGKTNA